MKVTRIDIFPVRNSSKLKAKCNVSVCFENQYEIGIKGMRIHDDGIKPIWVGVPSEKYLKDGVEKYADMLWLNQLVQSDLLPKIISEYKKTINISKSV